MAPIYDFSDKQQFVTIDKVPDFRTDEEKTNSPLSVYNHDNPDIGYAERQAEEIINLSGAWITVYKRIRGGANRDDIWEEDPDPLYKNGIRLKGRFVPEPAKAALTKWGVDAVNKTTVQFSRATVFAMFKFKMIAEGDILLVPHNTLSIAQSTDLNDGPSNRIDQFVVVSSFESGNMNYRWLYWNAVCQNITGDKSIKVDYPSAQTSVI